MMTSVIVRYRPNQKKMSVCSPSSELPDTYHRYSPTQRSEQEKKKQQTITHSLLKSCMDRSVKSKLSMQNGLTSLVSPLDVWKDFYKDVLHPLVLWF